ncbi:hypothetical protein L6452_08165 [Arctium lappa]|uniref:Uncharacterized protein n=1 Tax=Arctium lappa TaxID=4217 RepID=A0ACB9DHC3_ARCLA|nr:hypothetical protein L6452_08165 [Arctium lappa]
MVPVKKHLDYLISSTKHVANMNTKMAELNATRSDVEDHKERNKSNSLKVPTKVPGWLEEVEKIDAQVKSIDSEVGSCFNLKGRHKLGRKACNIIHDINRLMEEKSRIDWTDIRIAPAEVNSTKASISTPSSDYNDFESRKSCPILETLVDRQEICEVEVITFPALKFLSLKALPMLLSLCKGGNVIELPQLEELELKSLPNFTSIYQHFLKKEVMNSKLKKLNIWNMEKLREIWPSQLSNDDQVITQLRVIEVVGCDSLMNLFPSNPMSLVHHLERLTICNCGSIDVIFNIDLGSSCVGEIEEDSCNLRDIKVMNLGELREVWRVKGVNNSNDDLPILGFQNVECIEIYSCKSLRNVFTPTTSNFDMKALTMIILNGFVHGENESDNSQIGLTRNSLLTPCSIARPYEMVQSSQVEEVNVVAFSSYLIQTCCYLHTLHISGFKRVEVVFEMETANSRKLITTLSNQQPPLLPHLKDLIVEGMQKMSHVWKYDWNQFIISQQEPTSSSFPNLGSIRLTSSDSIKYLFSPLMMKHLSNLNSITIHDCNAIEEVVSNEYEEIATSISSNTNTTFLPHIDIDLSRLRSLKRIDGVSANRLASVTATVVHDKLQCSQNQLYNSSMCSTSNITQYLQFPWSFSNLIEVDVRCRHELRWEKTIFPSNELVKVENVGDIDEADKVFEGTNDETQSADDDDVNEKAEAYLPEDEVEDEDISRSEVRPHYSVN